MSRFKIVKRGLKIILREFQVNQNDSNLSKKRNEVTHPQRKRRIDIKVVKNIEK